jgi:hypothetical protein
MLTLQEERENLAEADQHITAGERRVAEQILRIEEMEQRGEDTQSAREILQTLEETLEQWRGHRLMILDTIVRLTDSLPELSGQQPARHEVA